MQSVNEFRFGVARLAKLQRKLVSFLFEPPLPSLQDLAELLTTLVVREESNILHK